MNAFMVEFVNKLLTLQQACYPCKQRKWVEQISLMARLLTKHPNLDKPEPKTFYRKEHKGSRRKMQTSLRLFASFAVEILVFCWRPHPLREQAFNWLYTKAQAGLEDFVTSRPAWALGVSIRLLLDSSLEAEAIVLDTGIRNADEPDFLVTGGDVGNVEAKHFQAFLELFHGEIVLVQHDSVLSG